MQTHCEVPTNTSDLIAALDLTADFDAIVADCGLIAAYSAAMDAVLKVSDVLAADVTANGFRDDAHEDLMTAKMTACTKAFVMLSRARRAAREFDSIVETGNRVIN